MWSRLDRRPVERASSSVSKTPILVAFAGALSLLASAVVFIGAGQAPKGVSAETASVVVPHAVPRLTPPVIASTAIVGRPSFLPTMDEEWAAKLRDPSLWASRRSGSDNGTVGNVRPSRPSALGNPEPRPPAGLFSGIFDDFRWGGPSAPRQSSATYRTVCVRLCDGYYWPISYATTRSSFERDAAKCEASCGGAKLYVYRNPGEEAEDMVDLRGQPYTRLTTAFLYRTQYDAQCKCQPHPWEEAARLRHRIYALEAAARQGDRKAASELQGIRASERQTRNEKRAETDASEGKRPRRKSASSSKSKQGSGSAAKVAARPAPSNGVVIMRLGATRQVVQAAPSRPRNDDWRRAVYGQ